MFGENDENIAKKIQKAQEIGITSICCLYGDCREEVGDADRTNASKITQ